MNMRGVVEFGGGCKVLTEISLSTPGYVYNTKTPGTRTETTERERREAREMER